MQDRIKYLDVAKFIGIFCIYLGHFGDSSGNAYNFVFTFHVPLFFFLSGCAENLSSNIPWYKYIWKNIKNILIPCYLFAIISIIIQSIYLNTHTLIVPNFIDLLNGCIRNHFFAGSLWFLTCLFVLRIAFYFLRKLLKFKFLILLVCVIIYCIAQLVITPKPIVSPHLPYNIDSMCYYMIFYALGYCCFGAIKNILTLDSVTKKTICLVVGAVSFVYTVALFFGKNLLYYLYSNTIALLINSVVGPVIVILLILIVSKLLENVDLFVEIGKNTLFLCGTEYIIKLLVSTCFRLVGLEITFPNPIAAYIYTFALLILCYKTLIPIEKKFFKSLKLL